MLSPGAAPAAAVELRPAGKGDLEPLVDLLLRRDAPRADAGAARRTLRGLDPARCLAWAAWSGGRPVGLSTVLVRAVTAGARTYRAGYWCALYVDPAFRQRMVYPLLPRAMHRGLVAGGIDFVYASVRIPWLVAAHQRIGLRRLGDMTVVVKPLAPAALLARHHDLGLAVELAGRPVDLAAAGYRRLRWTGALAGHEVEALPWDAQPLAEVEPLWIGASAARVGQPWTAALLAARYGDPDAGYALLGVRRRGRLVAAAVARAAPQGRLLVGVLLDAAAEDPDALGAALAAVERWAHERGCQAVLALDGPGALPAGTLRRAGYLPSPERYTFLVWPGREPAPGSPLLDLSRWRFAFGDHDAF